MSATDDDGPQWDNFGGQWTLADPNNDKAWVTSDTVLELDKVA